MKADLTRQTFNRSRHYRGVVLQQGRPNVDADWNEQAAIAANRIETETLDVVGPCGGPMDAAGFRAVAAAGDLSAADQARPENQAPASLAGAGDFYISGGRYYVRGRLTENDHIVPFTSQPHLPGTVPVTDSGVYVAYLDVWDRHVTALEDPAIREVALGGVDTATRIQTVWQLKLVRTGGAGDAFTCLSASPAYNEAIASPTGLLAARAQPGEASSSPCIVAPGAGYRRLENQLYRIEVHGGGPRGTATFKWSRDNGSVVARWESQSAQDITVASAGRDSTLSFASGMWVELVDDERELLGAPGTLVRIASVRGRVLTLDTPTADGPTDLPSFGTNPRVRRWDSAGTLRPVNSQWIDLEDGVQAQFSNGTYRTGDYWLIPARTVTGDIEWPQGSSGPLPRAPQGIEHRYCRVAVMRFDGAAWTAIGDCRHLFPPLTELTELQYVSGDGQEALPGTQLDRPLQVGVANGERPVAGARVRFSRVAAAGALVAGSGVEESGNAAARIVLTGVDGLAEVNWQLGDPSTPVTQQVLAELLDVANNRVHLPVRFHARLSLASQVWYDNTGCSALSGTDTVQEAVATLAAQARLVRYSGEGQHAGADRVLPRPIEVVVASPCGPVAGATVTFTPEGAGVVAPTASQLPAASPGPLAVTTDGTGLARVAWRLDGAVTTAFQQLRAEITAAAPRQIHAPAALLFTASSERCCESLDDLRSDGVVRRPPQTELGLAVSAGPAGSGRILYTSGRAYVGGCRFDVSAGSLALDPQTLPNQVIVDGLGNVVLLDKANVPPAFATLADVYLFEGQILRIVDRRLDLTHLDEQLRDLREHVAAKRCDRRGFIPLLAHTLRDAEYRDGRTHAVAVPSATGLAFDGDAMWAASFGTTTVARIRHDAPTGSTPELVEIGAITHLVAYDGDTHVWFTSPFRTQPTGGTIPNNQVFAVDRRTREIRSLTVGSVPIAIAFDGGRVWVANSSSRSISVIDIERFRVIRTIAVPQPPDGAAVGPTALAFDGQFMWVGTNSATMYRVDASTALTPVVFEGLQRVAALAFDGASIWFSQGVGANVGAVGSIDVVSDEARFYDLQGTGLLCDATRMWVLATTAQSSSEFQPIDCTTGSMIGRRLTIPGLSVAGAFDGSHLWLSVFSVPAGGLPSRLAAALGPQFTGGYVRRFPIG